MAVGATDGGKLGHVTGFAQVFLVSMELHGRLFDSVPVHQTERKEKEQCTLKHGQDQLLSFSRFWEDEIPPNSQSGGGSSRKGTEDLTATPLKRSHQGLSFPNLVLSRGVVSTASQIPKQHENGNYGDCNLDTSKRHQVD